MSEDRPIACSLGSARLAQRAEELRKGVLGSARRVEPIGNGMRWYFDATPELVTHLAPIIDAERECCRFLRFHVTAAADLGEIVLEVTGPPGTGEFLRAWV